MYFFPHKQQGKNRYMGLLCHPGFQKGCNWLAGTEVLVVTHSRRACGWGMVTVEISLYQQGRMRDKKAMVCVLLCTCAHAHMCVGICESKSLWRNFRLYDIWREEERGFLKSVFVRQKYNFL